MLHLFKVVFDSNSNVNKVDVFVIAVIISRLRPLAPIHTVDNGRGAHST